MAMAQLTTRIDARIKKALEHACKARGWKMNRFIQEALVEKLEELEDLEDLKRIRHEPTRPLAELLRDLKVHGRL
jgi:uncharacterized protein (DUF1778 family)